MSDKQPEGSGSVPSSNVPDVVSTESLNAVIQSGRRRRLLGFVGAATVVFVVVGGALAATQLGDSTSTTTTTHGDPTTSTTKRAGALFESSTGDRDDAMTATTTSGHTDPRRERIPEIPPAGTIAFGWETSEFPLPAGIDAWIQAITVVDAGYLAFGQGWEFEGGGEGDEDRSVSRPLVWESPDGLNWHLTNTGSFPADFELHNLLATDSGLVAVGMIFEDEPPRSTTPLVLTSPDGGSWASTELSANLGENEHLYMNDAVAGKAGIIVYGSIEFQPPQPPVVITKDGKSMVIDNDQFTLTISDDATGEVLYDGTPEEIWNDGGGETEEGLAVYDPATRALVLVVPWEVFDAAYDEVADDGGEESGISLRFESDGYRLILDEEFDEDGGTFQVEDVASGAILFSGPSNDLFSGLPPRFEDQQGNVILEFTWEEFYRAEEDAYGGFEEGFEDQYRSRPIVFHSVNGRDFSQVDLGPLAGNQNAWVNSALAGEDGFTLLGSVSNPDSGETMVSWHSPNGIDWTRAAIAGANPYVWSIVATETRLLGLGDGEAIWASTGTSDWEAVLAPGGQDGTEIGLWQLQAGGLGVFAQGEQYQFEEHSDADVFTLDYTTQEGLRVVVEGDYVLLFDQDDHVLLEGFAEELTADRDGEPRIETDEDGMVRFYAGQGELLLEVSEDELEAGSDDSVSSDATAAPATTIVSHDGFDDNYIPPEPVLYYSPDGQEFYQVALDGQLTGFFFNQVAVGPDRVILIGEEATFEEQFDGTSETFQRTLTVFVGKPPA